MDWVHVELKLTLSFSTVGIFAFRATACLCRAQTILFFSNKRYKYLKFSVLFYMLLLFEINHKIVISGLPVANISCLLVFFPLFLDKVVIFI